MRRIERGRRSRAGRPPGKTTVSFGSTGRGRAAPGLVDALCLGDPLGGGRLDRLEGLVDAHPPPPAVMSTRRSGAPAPAAGRSAQDPLEGGRRGGAVDRHAELQAALERAPGDLGVVVDAPAADAPPPLAAHNQDVAVQRDVDAVRIDPGRVDLHDDSRAPVGDVHVHGGPGLVGGTVAPPGNSSAKRRSTSSLCTRGW